MEPSLYNKLRRQWDNLDDNFTEVLSGAFIAFTLRGLGAVLSFALNAVIARELGAESAGLYFLALSVVMILSVIARLGLDRSLLRFIAVAATDDAWGRVRKIFRVALSTSLIVASIFSVLLIIFAQQIAEQLFKKPEMELPLAWIAFVIVSFSALTLIGESLKGLKRIADAMLVMSVFAPLISLLIIWWGGLGTDAIGIIKAYIAGTICASLLGWGLWMKALRPRLTNGDATISIGEIAESAKPLFVMSVLQRAVLPWVPMFLLGIWGTNSEAGIFGICLRIAILVSFFLMAMNTVAAPMFAALHRKNNKAALILLARRVALITTVLTAPCFLVLMLAPEWVLSLFGAEFKDGASALRILAIGQLFSAFSGSVGFLLIMTGHEKDARNSVIIATIAMLFIAFTVMPTSKTLIGAAYASMTALIVTNVLNIWLVKKRLGFIVLPGGIKS